MRRIRLLGSDYAIELVKVGSTPPRLPWESSQASKTNQLIKTVASALEELANTAADSTHQVFRLLVCSYLAHALRFSTMAQKLWTKCFLSRWLFQNACFVTSRAPHSRYRTYKPLANVRFSCLSHQFRMAKVCFQLRLRLMLSSPSKGWFDLQPQVDLETLLVVSDFAQHGAPYMLLS